MFVKGKALQGLKRYDEAMEMVNLIRETCAKSIDVIIVDKKQYLLEAELNTVFGNSNIDNCIRLIKNCPNYLPSYILLRKDARGEGLSIEVQDDDEDILLVKAFNNEQVSDDDFMTMLEEADKSTCTFKRLSYYVMKINEKTC